MDEKKKSVLEKIKKLFVMSKRGTDNEQKIAFMQAQKLMAKHHIDEVEIIDNEKLKVKELRSSYVVNSDAWLVLANVIAKNFRCENYINTIRASNKKKENYVVFVGIEIDVIVAIDLFEKAYDYADYQSKNIVNWYRKHRKSSKGVRDQWLIGFIKGLDKGFEEQINLSSELAIMITIPQEVKEHFGNLVFNGQATSRKLKGNGDSNLYMAGFENGKNFAYNKKQKVIV